MVNVDQAGFSNHLRELSKGSKDSGAGEGWIFTECRSHRRKKICPSGPAGMAEKTKRAAFPEAARLLKVLGRNYFLPAALPPRRSAMAAWAAASRAIGTRNGEQET